MSTMIAELSETMERMIAENEQNVVYEEIEEHEEMKKISVTTRFDEFQVFIFDSLAKKLDSSRAAVLNELATAALVDILERLDLLEEFKNNFKKEVKKGGVKNV